MARGSLSSVFIERGASLKSAKRQLGLYKNSVHHSFNSTNHSSTVLIRLETLINSVLY